MTSSTQKTVKWCAPAPGSPIVQLTDANFRAGGSLVFPHSNWTIAAGECWALIGDQHSGRNQLIHGLCGEIPHIDGDLNYGYADCAPRFEQAPESGIVHVLFEDQQVEAGDRSTFAQSRWNSGLDTDEHSVKNFLSYNEVHEINPYEVCDPDPAGQRRYRAIKKEALRLLEIDPLLKRSLDQLSNGERRKVFLARALLKDPVLLILEHPFEGLDRSYVPHLQKVFRTLAKQGLHLMFALPSESDLPTMVTHVATAHAGKLTHTGPRKKKSTKLTAQKKPTAIRLPATWKKGLRKPTPAKTPTAELKNVEVKIDDHIILQGVNWTIQPGECWALSGPNGAGKSTLLSLLHGDNPQAYANHLKLFGKPYGPEQSIWDVKQRVASVSPEGHLYFPGDLTLIEVVCTGFFNSIRLFDAPSAKQKTIAFEWLKALGLEDQAQEFFANLSTEDQRFALIARAIVRQVDLLILDEPCMGLTPRHRARLLTLIDRIVKTTGCTLIYVSHRRDEWPSCITHRISLKQGRVTRSGPLKKA